MTGPPSANFSRTNLDSPYNEKDGDWAVTPTTESMSGTLKMSDGSGGDLVGLEQDREKHIGHWDPNPDHPHQDDHADEAAVREGDGQVVTFPDGGWRAWLVVLGAGHTLFCTFGFVVSTCAVRI